MRARGEEKTSQASVVEGVSVPVLAHKNERRSLLFEPMEESEIVLNRRNKDDVTRLHDDLVGVGVGDIASGSRKQEGSATKISRIPASKLGKCGLTPGLTMVIRSIHIQLASVEACVESSLCQYPVY